MQPIPEDVTMSDVWQWLNRGWFFYSTEGTMCVTQVDEGEDGHLIAFPIGKASEELDPARAFPHWPTCGAVNMNGYAVHVERTPLRQYRRTYNSRCVRLEIPRKWEVMNKYPDAKYISPSHTGVIEALFTPTYYNYRRAVELLTEGWVSVAVNRHLILAGTPEDHSLYYGNKLLAQVQSGTLVPFNPASPRNIRVLKWLDGEVAYV